MRRLLFDLARAHGLPARQAVCWASDHTLPVYDAAEIHGTMIDGRWTPFETAAEAVRSLERLAAAVGALGPYADHALTDVDLPSRRQLLEMIDEAARRVRLRVRRGPQSNNPWHAPRGRPRKLALKLALAWAELAGRPPPSSHPDQLAAEHPYHAMVREAFALAGFVGWKNNARDAALQVIDDKKNPNELKDVGENSW